ncbi:hypothetical protein Adt_41514 [Abeliophyllum distichum]|uniref:Uncharacterized protein n=1 Tax=Abeliophyllum distichum TaxID=126358 RepID=A0ABD1PP20_9LAMI
MCWEVVQCEVYANISKANSQPVNQKGTFRKCRRALVFFFLENEQATRFSFFKFTFVTGFKPGDEAEYKNKIMQDERLFEKYFVDGDKITPNRLYEAFDNEEDDMPSHLYEAFDNEEDDMDDKYKLGLACIYESVLRTK